MNKNCPKIYEFNQKSLIKQAPTNSEKSDFLTTTRNHKKPYKTKVRNASYFAIGLALVALLSLPIFAYAKGPILSFLFGADVLASNDAVADQHNTQTLPLTQADLSPLTGAKNSALNLSSAMVPEYSQSDSALSATTGPLGAASSIEEETSAVSADDLSIYVVHQGDTLSAVAGMFHVTEATIISANDLTKGMPLVAGDVLVIPPVSGVMYTVAKGDTLGGIAHTYSVDASDISAFNNLDGAPLKLGQKIIIPGATAIIKKDTSKSKVNKKESSGISSMLRAQGNKKLLPDFFGWPLPTGMRKVTQGIHDGDAVDFHAPTGTRVLASANGTIVVAKFNGPKAWFGGFGNFIVIDHGNGVKTLYAHLSGVNVVVGQPISQGDLIGLTGNTGHSSGPHLHFAVIGAQHPYVGNTWKK